MLQSRNIKKLYIQLQTQLNSSSWLGWGINSYSLGGSPLTKTSTESFKLNSKGSPSGPAISLSKTSGKKCEPV